MVIGPMGDTFHKLPGKFHTAMWKFMHFGPKNTQKDQTFSQYFAWQCHILCRILVNFVISAVFWLQKCFKSDAFLPKRDYVTFGYSGICRRNYVCRLSFRLSSVTFVHPTQPVEIFDNISTPFCSLAIRWPPCKILRRSSQGNPSIGGKMQEA